MSKRRPSEELLFGDQLSDREKKAILQRVTARQSVLPRRLLWSVLATGALACSLVLIVRPRTDDFAARGEATAALSAECAGGCKVGSTLLVSYDTAVPAHLHVRLQSPSGEVTTFETAVAPGHHVADRGATLDQAGRWKVELELASDRTLGKRELSIEAAP